MFIFFKRATLNYHKNEFNKSDTNYGKSVKKFRLILEIVIVKILN